MDTLLAIDGNSLMHRAWHAYEATGRTDPVGKPNFAVYGFLALLAGICDKVRPSALVVGFDDATSSVRKDRCGEYKANRSAKDPDLYAQMAALGVVLADLGITVVTAPGLEADDVIGSAAAASEAAGWKCVIATSDRDAFSQISDSTSVLRLVSGLDNAVLMDPEALHATVGVWPGQYLDYAAIRGDTSDNLAGVRGIGAKTAAKLLAEFGSLDGALADPERCVVVLKKSVAASLASEEAAANIARNRDVMTIVRSVPIDIETCRLGASAEQVKQVLVAVGLVALVERGQRAFGTQRVLAGAGVGLSYPDDPF